MHACPGEFTKLEWTFEASDTSAGAEKITVISNNSIHLKNVKQADAGTYTCWISRCVSHRQKLVTLNLCVITGMVCKHILFHSIK